MTLANPMRLFPHLLAIALSMTYAWHISKTEYVTTGLQFVAPLLIILLCHLAIRWFQARLQAAYARVVLSRSLVSAILLALLVFATEQLAPSPSYAETEAVFKILTVLFCLVILAFVIGIAAGTIYLVYHLVAGLFHLFRGRSKDSDLHDFASVSVAVAFLFGASLEGVPGAYKFEGTGHSVATYTVDASPQAVWAAMQTATSPDFPLPPALDMFPQPVAVLLDEGTGIGANRIVLIRGREGEGELHLRVTHQADLHAVFSVVSDTSPTGRWVAFKSLGYKVTEHPGGALIEVRLDYERLLAPAWIFDPMVERAAHLAASVLARDTKIRAEHLQGDPSVAGIASEA